MILNNPVNLKYANDFFPISARSYLSHNNRILLNEINYMYKFRIKTLIEERKGVPSLVVIDSDPISFYLRHEPKPELLHLTSKRRVLAQEDKLLFACQNLANGCHHGGNLTYNIETLPEAILQLRKSFEAGYEDTRKKLGLALSNYAVTLTKGSTDQRKFSTEAINFLRESISLGYGPAKEKLGEVLFLYAVSLLDEGQNIESRLQNIPIVTALYREAYYECGIQEAKEQLAVCLTCHAVDIYDSSAKQPMLTKEERELSFKLLKEAYYVLGEEKAKEPLARMFIIDACSALRAQSESANTEKIQNMLVESARLGCREAQDMIDILKQKGVWDLQL